MSDDLKTSPIPVRFDKEENRQIGEISEKTGIPRAQIVRMAVKLFVRHVEKTGHMPIDPPYEKFDREEKPRPRFKPQKPTPASD